MIRIEHYINGELSPPRSGAYLDNIDPSTGHVYSLVPDGDAATVDAAVLAAESAFPAWSRTPADVRSSHLLRIADAIEHRLEEFALAECIDNGKPLSLTRSLDIPRAVKNFRFFATAILHARSETHVTDGLALNYTLRQPRGICGLISPWNLPLYLLSWKIAPAIATGNTAVAKPSEVTPMTAYLLSQVCRDVGLPPGVLNIVHGLGAKVGAAMTAHPGITTLSFTGGTVTGREVARSAAPLFKKVSLELGGKNPNIVFADAEMDKAVAESVRAAFANQGQICLCGSRIFVERSAYDEFVERFAAEAGRLRVGDPLEPGVDQGAIVSKAQFEKVNYYVKLAKEEGGKIVVGGSPPPPVNDRCRDGYFFSPTVITGLGPNCRVNQEEIFGPVATIIPFDAEDEVVAYANGTAYGLAATLWTQNLTRAHRLAERINSGTIWVNCWLIRDLRVPFGGMKQSGVGREGGDEALRFFTEPKNVCIAT
ncbi:MAG: aldehyde dehydrogenase [Phycisphaerae bacterium]|nr:aldehyde dehydrogenase [Phycisphaerae bacterium]